MNQKFILPQISWSRTWPAGAGNACPSSPTPPWFDLAPDWLYEILSPSTARVDRAEKLPLYAQWGVPHVWLVDPDLRTLEAYENQLGRWVLLATLKDNNPVSLPPFDAISFALGGLWAD